MATTLAWLRRLMPAMPIADSSAPIVVGARHTRSATSTVIVTGCPCPACRTLYSEYGSKVAHTTRKMMVSAASRMFRAISFGVFCRLAPSTMAIMRSRNVSPGWAVMRITSQSDSTRVPPVTAERSPPDSRITGADSPVTALSSTLATPSMISPSAGMKSPASTSTTSPFAKCRRGHGSERTAVPGLDESLGRHVTPGLAQTFRLGLAASLGHRLGEVGEQHGEPQPQRDAQDEPGTGFAPAEERMDKEHTRQSAADQDDEHHRDSSTAAAGPACGTNARSPAG